MAALESRFEAAVKVMNSLPQDGVYQPSEDMLLTFYSYHKQATEGPCKVPKPSFWDAPGIAKWEAWRALEDMPKEEAMAEYVEEIQLVLEVLPLNQHVAELLESLGTFYEIVDSGEDSSAEVATENAFSLPPPQSTPPVNGSSGSSEEEDGDDEESEDEGVSGLRPGSAHSLTSHSSLNSQEDDGELTCVGEVAHGDRVIVPGLKLQAGSRKHTPEEGAEVPLAAFDGGQNPPDQMLRAGDCGLMVAAQSDCAKNQCGLTRKDARGVAVACYHGNGRKEVAMALVRLQDNMRRVLQRLNTLEALTASQVRSLTLGQEGIPCKDETPGWWPFSASPLTVTFAVVWPALVHWLVRLYSKRRRVNC
ncbi:acyl-CoA-binding domain-containing protein 5-B isoform X2 [Denticeps clupeoides]|uniref:acyl-CoA-binding domain-containing protein 5-B isoform X2 n=1 Tax=Denticeps clupeoides TaxID=299321 RepID=UPI0010A3D8B9|nr:acyl-CoA-binding domain-containing protein 5-like isoform X2 [Denticeps clupeoides]